MANLMTTYTQSTLKNMPTTLDPNKFALPGCTFMGWSTDKENAVYVDGDTVAFDGDTTLYAVWARAQCTITFDANGGTGSTTADREYGSPLNLPETSRDGYTLVGWFTQVVDGKQVSSSTIVTGDATYYAVWETNNYDTIRVHFDAQGGTVELQ